MSNMMMAYTVASLGIRNARQKGQDVTVACMLQDLAREFGKSPDYSDRVVGRSIAYGVARGLKVTENDQLPKCPFCGKRHG